MIPQTNGCSLPSDLKEFYLTNNGLTLTWKYMYNGEFGHACECVQCCCCYLHSLRLIFSEEITFQNVKSSCTWMLV